MAAVFFEKVSFETLNMIQRVSVENETIFFHSRGEKLSVSTRAQMG